MGKWEKYSDEQRDEHDERASERKISAIKKRALRLFANKKRAPRS